VIPEIYTLMKEYSNDLKQRPPFIITKNHQIFPNRIAREWYPDKEKRVKFIFSNTAT
jgi:hypothetical protein